MLAASQKWPSGFAASSFGRLLAGLDAAIECGAALGLGPCVPSQ